MSNKAELSDAVDSLKNSVFEEIEKSGEKGINVSDIAENLSLKNKPWREHSVGGNYLVWSILGSLAIEGKITAENDKGSKKARVYAINPRAHIRAM